jgi:hypothetical protein
LGDIFNRDVLNYKQRMSAIISALASMHGVKPELVAYMEMSMKVVIFSKPVTETFAVIEKDISKPDADITRRALSKLLEVSKQEKQ